MKYKTSVQEQPSNESAYLLQWPGASPEDVLSILVQEHYGALLRLAQILESQNIFTSAKDLVLKTIKTALTYQEAQNWNAYHGQASVLAWLYRIMLDHVGRRGSFSFKRKQNIFLTFPKSKYQEAGFSLDTASDRQHSGSAQEQATALLMTCPEHLVLPALLRLMDGLSEEDIGYVLRLSNRKRQQLTENLSGWYASIAKKAPVPINAELFQEPVDFSSENDALSAYDQLERLFRETLKKILPQPVVDIKVEDEIIRDVLTDRGGERSSTQVYRRIGEIGLVGVLLLGLLSGAYYMNQIFISADTRNELSCFFKQTGSGYGQFSFFCCFFYSIAGN